MRTPPVLTHNLQDLQAIFRLRALAWKTQHQENSPIQGDVWQDDLDFHPASLHWVIREKEQVIASARLTPLNSMDELPYSGIFESIDFPDGTFAFYARMAVHPHFQGKGMAVELDDARFQFINENDIQFVIGTARNQRIAALGKRGFQSLGPVDPGKDETWTLGAAEIVVWERG